MKKDYTNIDGIMTSEKNVVLTTFYADCVPLFFYDKKENIIASSHAGWKGTLKQIAKETVIKMVEEFKSKPENIIACIGPSIHKCCFEVDKDVADMFYNYCELYQRFIKESESIDNKYYIDLQGINEEILKQCGVLQSNIETSNICTRCNNNEFYSHRHNGNNRGSLAAFIMLS